MNCFFNSNRFETKDPENMRKILAALTADNINITESNENRAGEGEPENIIYIFHICGTGELKYPKEGIASGLLTMTGNLPAFYDELKQLLCEKTAAIITTIKVDDDGWLAGRSAVMTCDNVEYIDLVGDSILKAANMLGVERYTTDTHAITQ